MREWNRVLRSKKLIGLFLFLLVLNLAMIRSRDYRSADDLQAYRREILAYQDMEPGLALEDLDNRMNHISMQWQLYDYIQDPDDRFYYQESLEEYFGEDFASYVPDKAAVDGMSREYTALSAVREQVQHLVDYPTYLDTVHANATQMAVLSIFSQESSFSRRNIEKTDRDFPKSVSLSLDNDLALNAFTSDRLCGYSILAVMMVVVLEFMEERKRGLWSLVHGTNRGRGRLALHRAAILLALSIGVTATLYGGKLLGLSLHYGGLGDLSRNIQSLAVFRDVPWVMSVRQFLVSYFLIYTAGVWLVSLILWAILQAVNHLPLAIAAASVFLAVEYTAFRLIPDSYTIVFLRYINIFAVVDILSVALHYLNLNLFGQPVQGILLSVGLVLPLTAVMVVLNLVLAEWKKPVSPQNSILVFIQRLRVPFSKLVGKLRLFGFELYKILWLQKGVVVLLVLGIYSFAFMDAPPIDSTVYNTEIAALAASMQGPITEDTLAQIDEKIATYETWDANLAVMRQLDILQQLRDKVTDSLSAGDGLWLMNQAGASTLISQNNIGNYSRNLALILLLAVCLLLPGCFASEKQNRMYSLLRGVPMGRGVLWRKKMGSAFLTAVLAYVLFEAGELYRLFSAYGALPLQAPIQSVDYFAQSALPLSIGGGLTIFLMLRLLAFLLAATVVLLLSQLSRQTNHAILLSAGVLLLPAGLQYIGIGELSSLSLALLFSPMECSLWYYAFAASLLPIILCIHYRFWIGYRKQTK